MPELRELWDDSLVATARAREILDAARAENREMNEEEEANWNAAIADSDRLATLVRQEIQVRDREASIAEHGRSLGYSQERVEDMRERQLNPPNPSVGQPQGENTRDRHIQDFLLGRVRGDVVPDAEVRGAGVPLTGNGIRLRHSDDIFGDMDARIRNGIMLPDGSIPRERDLTVGTANRGGNLVETSLMRMLEESMIRFNAVEQVATMIRTMDGSPLSVPTANDATNEGVVLAEAAAASELDMSFGQVALNVVKFSSQIVQISLELMQDSVFDMSSYLGSALGTRIGRAKATRFTTGTVANGGIVASAGAGVTATTSETLGYDDLIDLQASVDGAYAQAGSWMFNRAVEARAMKLRDANGLPIWHRDPRMGAPNMLHGYPIYINDKMVDFDGSAGTRPVLFGDMSKYYLRTAMDIELYRLDELYIPNGLIGFLAFERCGGALIDAGEDPIKAIVDKA